MSAAPRSPLRCGCGVTTLCNFSKLRIVCSLDTYLITVSLQARKISPVFQLQPNTVYLVNEFDSVAAFQNDTLGRFNRSLINPSALKCKKHFIKMLVDVGMVVPKIKETRSTNYAYTTMSD